MKDFVKFPMMQKESLHLKSWKKSKIKFQIQQKANRIIKDGKIPN